MCVQDGEGVQTDEESKKITISPIIEHVKE